MLQLDLKSRKSIYEQVMDQLKEQIMTGQMATGEKLPSVRELSKSITVNPNTVQKAYRELERQGYVYQRRRHLRRGSQRDSRGSAGAAKGAGKPRRCLSPTPVFGDRLRKSKESDHANYRKEATGP